MPLPLRITTVDNCRRCGPATNVHVNSGGVRREPAKCLSGGLNLFYRMSNPMRNDCSFYLANESDDLSIDTYDVRNRTLHANTYIMYIYTGMGKLLLKKTN